MDMSNCFKNSRTVSCFFAPVILILFISTEATVFNAQTKANVSNTQTKANVSNTQWSLDSNPQCTQMLLREIAECQQCDGCECGQVVLNVDKAMDSNFTCNITLQQRPLPPYGYFSYRVKDSVADGTVYALDADESATRLTFDYWYKTETPVLRLVFTGPTSNDGLPKRLVQYEFHAPDFENVNCSGTCPTADVQYRCRCYSLFVDTGTSWQSSLTNCAERNASLVMIKTKEEMDVIKLLLFQGKWLGRVVDFDRKSFPWIFIGLRRLPNDDHHTWLDGSRQVFSRWFHPGDATKFMKNLFPGIFVPNRLQPSAISSEACTAMMIRSLHSKVGWVKIPCSYILTERMAYICQTTRQPLYTELRDLIVPSRYTRYNTCRDSMHYEGKCYFKGENQSCPSNSSTVDDCNLVAKVFRYLKYYRLYGDVLCGNGIYQLTDSYSELNDELKRMQFFHANESRIDLRTNSTLGILCEKGTELVINACGKQQFRCWSRGECILNEYAHDHTRDCIRSEDWLLGSPKPLLGVDDFVCDDGRKISWSGYCDNQRNCRDGSDETECYFICLRGEYRCDNGQCIDASQRCDGIAQCIDKSDENSCRNCAKEGLRCYDGKCLPWNLYRDLIPDCEGNGQEDEPKSSASSTLSGRSSIIQNFDCPRNENRCHLSQPKCYGIGETCIFDEIRSSITESCRDGAHLERCAEYQCPGGYYKCRKSYCIPWRKVCDGVPDCPEKNDELNCRWKQCGGMFQCRDAYVCLPQSEVCDGVPHCPLGDDEKFCNIACPKGCRCDEHYVVCRNGFLDFRNYTIPRDTRVLVIENTTNFNLTALPDCQAYLLGYLDLSNNGIVNPNLRWLRPFQNFRNLRYLDLRRNRIYSLWEFMFSGLRSLRVLKLHGNEIRHVEYRAFFPGLYNMMSLDLSNQRLSVLLSHSFTGLQNVTSVNLSHNSLQSIGPNVFIGLDQLEHVDISHNPELVRIPPDIFGDLVLKTFRTDSFVHCCTVNRLNMTVRSCTPEPDMFSSCSDLMANYVLQVLVWVLGTMALLGNVFVIIWRTIVEKRRTANSFLILSLSLSDLLMGVYLFIIASADVEYRNIYYQHSEVWRRSPLCTCAGILNLLSSEVSVLMLLLISIDRYIAIVLMFKVRPMSMRVAVVLTGLGWLFVAFVCLIPIFVELGHHPIQEFPYSEFYSVSGTCMAFTSESAGSSSSVLVMSYIIILFNFLSFVAIAVLYSLIFLKVRNVRREVKSFDQTGDSNTQVEIAKKLFLVIATDFCCWMPIILIKFSGWVGDVTINPTTTAWIAVFVLPLNSAMNPFLFTISVVNLVSRKKKKSPVEAGNRTKTSPMKHSDYIVTEASLSESQRSVETVT